MRLALAALLLGTAAGAAAQTPADDAGHAYDLGLWLVQEGQPYRAAGEFLRAIYLAGPGPLALDARLALGRTLQRAGQLDRAQSAYRRFLDEGTDHPARASALFDLAWLALVGDDTAGARRAAQDALALSPPDEPARLHRERRARLLFGAADALEGLHPAAVAQLDVALAGCAPQDTSQDFDCQSANRLRALSLAGPPPGASPALAGVLAAVVPGAGHLYAGQHADALTYFALSALLGFLAIDGYEGARSLGGQRPGFYLLASGAAIVYTANVVSAWNAAVRAGAIGAEAYRRAFKDRPWPEPGSVR